MSVTFTCFILRDRAVMKAEYSTNTEDFAVYWSAGLSSNLGSVIIINIETLNNKKKSDFFVLFGS